MLLPGVQRMAGKTSEDLMTKSELIILLYGMAGVDSSDVFTSSWLKGLMFNLMRGQSSVAEVLARLGWSHIPHED